MHHIPRWLYSPSKTNPSPSHKPRLDRCNARYFDYDATRSVHLSRSFRVDGCDHGELQKIYLYLDLSGPEDFEIPTLVIRNRSDSDAVAFPCELGPTPSDERVDSHVLPRFCEFDRTSPRRVVNCAGIEGEENGELLPCVSGKMFDFGRRECDETRVNSEVGIRGGGIKGDRPPRLKPPPGRLVRPFDDGISTWDILKSFAPMCDAECSDEKDQSCGELCEVEDVNTVSLVDEASINRGELDDELSIEEVEMVSGSSFRTSIDDGLLCTRTECGSVSIDEKCGRVITNWQKGEILGSGTFGSVYKGFSGDGSFFAVKEVSLISQGDHGRKSILHMEQEIALLSQLKHPNIVRYYGTGKHESKLYIFLELVDQGSLANAYRNYTLGDSQVSKYTRQILCGLNYLHEQNMVHRDIKCANLLLDKNGSVKLADFGLAKIATNVIKSMKGTALWMAPEVVHSNRQGYGRPADIWSLGCTVLEMLTGHFPYHPLEWQQALFKIGRREPPPVPESLSTDAREFILQCLRVNPNDRPTAAQLLNHSFIRTPSQPSPRIGQ